MNKLLLMSIFFAFAIVVPTPTVAGVDIISGISLPPIIVFEAPPEVKVMPASDVYIVADVDADRPQADSTGKDEKRQNESLEKRKPTGSKNKSNLKINVLPRPDNMKSPIEKKEDQFHLPPDRY
jgi:hypothetical protein